MMFTMLVLALVAPSDAAQVHVPEYAFAAKLVNPDASPPSAFGSAVAVGDDFVVVADPVDGELGYEAIQSKIVSLDVAPGAFFGSSVAASDNRLLVGAPVSSAAYLFRQDGGRWSEVAKLTPSYLGGSAGYAVSLSLASDVAVVGAFGEEGVGAAYVYVRPGVLSGAPAASESWVEHARLQPSRPQLGADFGAAVAVDAHQARLIVVGAPSFEVVPGGAKRGTVYVFARDDGGTTGIIDDRWVQVSRLRPIHFGTAATPSQDAFFGQSVAVDSDTILVGTPRAEAAPLSGAVDCYRYDDGGTPGFPADDSVRRTGALDAKTGELGAFFGTSVAIHGPWALVGAPGASLGEGRAFVFKRSESGWSQVAELKPTTSSTVQFGWTVAIEDGVAVVNVPWWSGGQLGETLVYRRGLGGSWEQAATLPLVASGVQPFSFPSVAVSGRTVLVGVPGDPEFGGPNTGAVHAFGLEVIGDQ